MLTVKEVSSLLQITDKHIYRLLEKCRKEKDNIFSYGGLSFYIFRNGKGVTLEPVTEKNVDMEKIEDAAVAEFCESIIPHLCEHCRGPITRIKNDLLEDYAVPIPAAVPEPPAQAAPETVPAPEQVSCIITTHTPEPCTRIHG